MGNKCDLEDKREVDEADIRVSVPIRCQLTVLYREALWMNFSELIVAFHIFHIMFGLIIHETVWFYIPRGVINGLMASALISRSSGPGLNPGQGHCIVFFCKTLSLLLSQTASLRPCRCKWYQET